MKTLFVYPGIATIGFNSYESGDFSAKAVPLGIGYLAATLEGCGFETDILDLRYEKNFSTVEEALASSDAEIVALSVQTPSFGFAAEVAKIAKKYNKTVIAGGIHATINPDDFFSTGFFDYLITGEGEITLPELVKGLHTGTTMDSLLHGKPVTDMSGLPRPKDFPLYEKGYREVYNVETGRGCPARCTYCVSGKNQLFGREIKHRATADIVEGIDFFKKKYDFKNMAFEDVNATTNKTRFIDLCQRITSRYSDICLTISTRVDCFDEEVAEALSLFNDAIVWFGFESMSPRLMKFLKKGVNVKKNYKAVELCEKYGIRLGANVLTGVPTQTNEEIKVTYEFIKDIAPSLLYYNVLSPFPGTEIAEYCLRNNLLEKVENYERYEITQILQKGLIKGVDYDQVRAWHPRFQACTRNYDPLFVGMSFEQNKEYALALKEYEKSLKMRHKPGKSLYYMASLLKRTNRYDAALHFFNMMEAYTTELGASFMAKRHFHKGEIYKIQGQKKAAKEEFVKCLKLMPEHRKAKEFVQR
ncbi:MAG: cobalamin-dependent protein, partial [Nitrospinota bacterium]